jgi:hypothetical protein
MPGDPYAEIAKPADDPYAAIATPEMAHIGVNRGGQTYSPGYRYSTGYAGEGDAARDSGGFIDRAGTEFGRRLQDPKSFIPSWTSILGPLDPSHVINAYHEYQAARSGAPEEDPARRAGDLGPAVLTALVTHAADAVPNMGTASGSEFVPSGVAHPIEGAGRFVRALPRPNLVSAVKDPLGSVGRAAVDVPQAVKAGLGEDIRIQPRPRTEPAWKSAPTDQGLAVPSVLDREPTSAGPGRTVFPNRIRSADAPVTRVPLWKQMESEGTPVPSIVNQQPYANPARPRIAPPAAEPVAPGAAGSMVDSVTAPQPAPAAPPAVPTSKAALSRKLTPLLNDAVGVENPAVPSPVPLRPGISLKNQIKAAVQETAPLPEGFTPVESSALRGYKYDPAAREFEYITKDNTHYVRGDVDPEAAAQFEKTAKETGSHGKAWDELRKNPRGGVGQFKVINGVRQAVKPAANRSIVIDPETGEPELADVVAAKQAAKAPAAEAAPKAVTQPRPAKPSVAAVPDDLTSILQQSVDRARAFRKPRR